MWILKVIWYQSDPHGPSNWINSSFPQNILHAVLPFYLFHSSYFLCTELFQCLLFLYISNLNYSSKASGNAAYKGFLVPQLTMLSYNFDHSTHFYAYTIYFTLTKFCGKSSFLPEYNLHIGMKSLFSDFVSYITTPQCHCLHLMNIYWRSMFITYKHRISIMIYNLKFKLRFIYIQSSLTLCKLSSD